MVVGCGAGGESGVQDKDSHSVAQLGLEPNWFKVALNLLAIFLPGLPCVEITDGMQHTW